MAINAVLTTSSQAAQFGRRSLRDGDQSVAKTSLEQPLRSERTCSGSGEVLTEPQNGHPFGTAAIPEAPDQETGQTFSLPSAALRAKAQYSMSLWPMCPTVTPKTKLLTMKPGSF